MPEWSIGPHSKCGERATVPGVRIPLSPLKKTYKKLSLNLVGFFVSKKLHQKCTDPVSTRFYGHFSNCTYPIHPIPLSHSTRQHKMCGVIFLPFQSKRCTKKGNHPCSSLLKMAFHKHSPLLISDSKIGSHRLRVLVSSVCSNHLFRPSFFCTMNYKSSSSCVCRKDVAYPNCDIASITSAILCLIYLPRYSQKEHGIVRCRVQNKTPL